MARFEVEGKMTKSTIYISTGSNMGNRKDYLNHAKLAIENLVGSKASFQNGPREIDIDILFYGDEIIAMDNLVIPHPRLHERAFVLIPMLDLNSEFIHPEFDKTISEAAKSVDKQGVQQFAELEQCGKLTTNT